MLRDPIGSGEVIPSSRSAQGTGTVEWLTVSGAEARAWARQTTSSMPFAPLLARTLRDAASRTPPVIVVRGLPFSPEAPMTPYEGGVDLPASRLTIRNLLAVVTCLGLHPVAYAGECASVLHTVCPEAKSRGKFSSRGFDAALPFHTDYADRPIDEPVTDRSPAAAALVFAVERAEPSVPMECASVSRLLAQLSPEDIRIGRAEEFRVDVPDIFGGGSPRLRRLILPDGRIRLNLAKMTGETARAKQVLGKIHDILSDNHLVEQIHVRRGDIVVMNNQRAIHRRASFTPRWDATDRYFIRMSAVRDPGAGLPADPLRPWMWL